MTRDPCPDVAAADWIMRSDVPWQQLVCFGPAGFASYARLRFLPDPEYPGQSENDAEAEDWRTGQLPRLFEVLAAHTGAPADGYHVCVWDGWGQEGPPGPKVVVPNHEFWLFRGSLDGLGHDQPAFVWPTDRAWCFAQDVDPHWAGIGGSARLIDQLVADPHLDVVPADPAGPQPSFR